MSDQPHYPIGDDTPNDELFTTVHGMPREQAIAQLKRLICDTESIIQQAEPFLDHPINMHHRLNLAQVQIEFVEQLIFLRYAADETPRPRLLTANKIHPTEVAMCLRDVLADCEAVQDE
jgi:hypothetical protein